jgi:hypothetical protein
MWLTDCNSHILCHGGENSILSGAVWLISRVHKKNQYTRKVADQTKVVRNDAAPLIYITS